MKIPRVKELRENRALSQTQLAHMAGVGLGTVSRIEKGLDATPATAGSIAAALGVRVADLREGGVAV